MAFKYNKKTEINNMIRLFGFREGIWPVLSQSSIRSIECVEYPELGMEAIWKSFTRIFQMASILVDDKGNDFFKKLGL